MQSVDNKSIANTVYTGCMPSSINVTCACATAHKAINKLLNNNASKAE